MALRLAVIGTGAFAREHLLALRSVGGAHVVAVGGSDAARAAAAAALVPGAEATTDMTTLVRRSDIDAVDVCNATPGHARWTIAAGEAGKHVLVDKPAALSLADFDAMVAATEGNGRSLMVGQTVRFQPAMREIARAVHAGDIGTLRLLHLTWYVGHVWPGGWRSWQQDVAQSGGHPVHNGVHAIDLATWLLGTPLARVFARDFPTFAPGMAMPDSFHLQVQFEGGALATLEISYGLRQPGDMLRRLVVVGTAGSLVHDSTLEPGLSSPGRPAPPASVEGALPAELAHWVAAVGGREDFVVRTPQVRAALAAALAAQRSLETGRVVSVGEVE